MRKLQPKRGTPAAAAPAAEPTVVTTRTGPSRPKLPHERDESPELPAKRDAKMVQAEKDLAAGQQDTDRRGDARKTFARSEKQRR